MHTDCRKPIYAEIRSVARLIKSSGRLAFVVVLGPIALAGCIATGSPTPEPVVSVPVKTVTKDDKLLAEGKPVNDYVNSNVPSQVSYSLQVLNAVPEEGDYPQIAEIEPSEMALKSVEERKRLEEELLLLRKKRDR